MTWQQTSTGKQTKNLVYTLSRLTPNSYYIITSNEQKIMHIKSNADGALIYHHNTATAADTIIITKG